jgi:hypothetical protein
MTQSKYNPNKNGNAQHTHHYQMNYDKNGVYLIHGNGCKIFNDCFNCPPKYENNCQYGNKVIGANNVSNQRTILKPFNSFRPPESQLE